MAELNNHLNNHLFDPNRSETDCAVCGHPRSDHPMNDVCWHEISQEGKAGLCSCPGYQPVLQARTASEPGL